MTTKWLSQAEQASWRNYILTAHDLAAALEADLAVHDLTMGDYEVLVWLSEAEDNRMRMCDLAQSLQLSPSGLTRRLDGMVKAGWVERASCAQDRRVMYAHLTTTGRAKMEAAAPTHVDSVRRHVLDPLGAEGVAQLGEIFGRIREHLLELELTRV
ncbi:MAG: MarR family transcriptional regulator [Actinobacteria bacterium]|nr:MarR family transcriptional regulator [Actinomycetota bacterium]